MPDKPSMPINETRNIREWLFTLGPLLLLATALRLVSLFKEPLLNPDGIAYILQAKAFYLQQTEPFLTAYPYPTNLALMIAGIYRFVGDWILAGQLISILFSLLTIIPFYFLNRIFWPRRTATIITMLVLSGSRALGILPLSGNEKSEPTIFDNYFNGLHHGGLEPH